MRDVVPAVCADRLQQPVWPAHIYAQSAPRAANPKMNQDDEDHARLTNSHAIDRARVVHRVITSLIEEHRCTRSNPAGRVAACAHARGPHVRAAVVSYDGLYQPPSTPHSAPARAIARQSVTASDRGPRPAWAPRTTTNAVNECPQSQIGLRYRTRA